MDRFLFAHNPLKPAGATGLQGYIIDTVKNVWLEVSIVQQGKETTHQLQLCRSGGDAKEDQISCVRAARWYDSWLIQQRKEAEVLVSWANV